MTELFSLFLGVYLGICIGWYAADVRKRIKRIELFSLVRSKKENPIKPKSMIVEPMSIEERAIKEHQDLVESLNREA